MPTLVAIGCSSGLGLGALSHWCHRLVSLPRSRPSRWRILAGQRSPLDAPPTPEQRTLAALCTAHPDSIHLEWLALDLASSDSVRAFAHQVHSRTDSVDALVLNAATWTADPDTSTLTVDGRQWTLEAVVNALAQHLLVDLLEPLLVVADPSSSSARSRIIVTTSKLHSSVTSLDDLVAQLHPPTSTSSTSTSPSTRSSTGKSRYAASKALQLVSAAYWATTLAEKGVDVVAVSPGFVPTTALSRAQSSVARWAMRHLVSWLPFAVSADEGAARIARCFPLGVEPPSPPLSSAQSPSSSSDAPAELAPPQEELLPLFDALRAASTPAPPSSSSSSSSRHPAAPPPLLYLTAPSTSRLPSPLPLPLSLPCTSSSSSSPSPPPAPAARPARPAPEEAPHEPPRAAHAHAHARALDVGGGVAQELVRRAGGARVVRGHDGGAWEEEEEEESAARAQGWDAVGREVLGPREGEGESWGAVRRWEWGAARAASEAGREGPRDELGVD
ncbi:hypothetical protein JCM3775_007287 [Rhodotorula graminis]